VEEALRQYDRRQDVSINVAPCSILTRPGDIDRIVEELVDNACKFSRQGTPIWVELTEDGRLIATDQGRGMTSAQIARIGAFQQFDRKKHEQQGLGLGLGLVQKLVTRCGATLHIDSQPGEGTQVQVVFALAAPAEAISSVQEAQPSIST
jgi:signal transduction histidine kinase